MTSQGPIIGVMLAGGTNACCRRWPARSCRPWRLPPRVETLLLGKAIRAMRSTSLRFGLPVIADYPFARISELPDRYGRVRRQWIGARAHRPGAHRHVGGATDAPFSPARSGVAADRGGQQARRRAMGGRVRPVFWALVDRALHRGCAPRYRGEKKRKVLDFQRRGAMEVALAPVTMAAETSNPSSTSTAPTSPQPEALFEDQAVLPCRGNRIVRRRWNQPRRAHVLTLVADGWSRVGMRGEIALFCSVRWREVGDRRLRGADQPMDGWGLVQSMRVPPPLSASLRDGA